MKIPILRLPYTDEEISYIKEEITKVLKSGYLTMGEKVRAFEAEFAKFCGVKYAIGTNSGTSALEIPLRVIGVENGTVVMPSNTYMATPLAAIKAGAKVIFTECQRENLQMDPSDLEKKIRGDTRAVVLVHIGGIITPHIEKIQELCSKYNLPLIEDAAHAHGASFKEKRAGTFGEAAAFSFYPTKVLTTAEGGMLVTNQEEIYQKGLVLREHGKANRNYNIHIEVGDNWRFSEFHAVLGLQQMRKAQWLLSERRRLASIYDSLLAECSNIERVEIPDEVKSAYYKYIVYLKEGIDRAKIKQIFMERFEIQLPGEVYAHPCHKQPLFGKYPSLLANDPKDSFPITEAVCAQHICLPLYPGLSDDEVTYVVDCLKKIL